MHRSPHLLRREVHLFNPFNEAHLITQSNGLDEWAGSIRPTCWIEYPLLATSERTVEATLKAWLGAGRVSEHTNGEESG